MSELTAARGLVFAYAPIDGLDADLLLVTHEHLDHNAVEAVGGDPAIAALDGRHVRLAGRGGGRDRLGARRLPRGRSAGPNTIYRFTLDGLRICHLGDLGQPALRPEQQQAIGEVDVAVRAGRRGPDGGRRAGGGARAGLAAAAGVPMHYRTDAVNFLEPPDAFLEALGAPVARLDENELDVDAHLEPGGEPRVVLPAAPTR